MTLIYDASKPAAPVDDEEAKKAAAAKAKADHEAEVRRIARAEALAVLDEEIPAAEGGDS
jgi:hypothetical protein